MNAVTKDYVDQQFDRQCWPDEVADALKKATKERAEWKRKKQKEMEDLINPHLSALGEI